MVYYTYLTHLTNIICVHLSLSQSVFPSVCLSVRFCCCFVFFVFVFCFVLKTCFNLLQLFVFLFDLLNVAVLLYQGKTCKKS